MTTTKSGTTVVDARTEPFDVCICRPIRGATNPILAAGSRWFVNPFRVGENFTAEQAIMSFVSLWRARLAGKSRRMWRARLLELRGKRIGVFGDIQRRRAELLVALLEEFMP